MAERREIRTRNMWSFISSHDLDDFIQRNHGKINNIFLDQLYRHVRFAGFKITVTNIRLGVAYQDQGGLYIDIEIINNRGGNVFNNLHVSIHSIPLGKSQSHITTNDNLGPRNRLNLNFIKYIDSNEIRVELENPRELDGFYDIHRLREYYNDHDLRIINYILSTIIPRGIQNIIAGIPRYIDENISLVRSQSLISDEERQTILDNLYNMLNIERNIDAEINTLNIRREHTQNEIDGLMGLDRLTETDRYRIDALYRDIHHIDRQLNDLYDQYRENSKKTRLLHNRLQPYFTIPREFRKKYLKYKQKYLQLKKSLNINDV